MLGPIMCGVSAISWATRSAGRTASSYFTCAILVFQSTLTDWMPFTFSKEDSTVFVHGGQWRPVIRNVAFVALSSLVEASFVWSPRATPMAINNAIAKALVKSLIIDSPFIRFRELNGLPARFE